MISKKIIVVDDEDAIREMVVDTLDEAGFIAIGCPDTDTGYARITKSNPDLVILDVKMPTVGGIELCRMLRANAKTKNIPVIMLTVEATETDKVIGLGIGADDYIVKPFSPKELVARIKSLLRRSEGSDDKSQGNVLKAAGLEINLDSQTVKYAGKLIELRPKEFDLVVLMVKKPNVVLDRSFILENVFGYKIPISTRTIDTHIKNLRHALGPFGKKIKTVFGRGFKFVP